MKKALMYASVASMIDLFNMNNIKILQKLGYQVDVACNFEEGSITSDERVKEFKQELENSGIRCFQIPIPRKLSRIKDIKESYRLTKELADRDYDLVHCHSPIGSVICRYAFRKSSARMIYTAHGFHFFKGAPLKNWLIFYPIERWMARYTDTLITINQEDYERAAKFRVRNNVVKINGIGIDASKFKQKDFKNRDPKLTKELQIKGDSIVLASVGQLSVRKNHSVIIQALSELKNDDIKYLIIGEGELREELTQLIKREHLEEQVSLLGYRSDVDKILQVTDIFVFPSLQEGLPVSLMEAMGTGLPCITSDIRGNSDLIDHNLGGYLCNNTVEEYVKEIKSLIEDKHKRLSFGRYNLNKISDFDKNVINQEMEKIYSK
ncbi:MULTISPECIES: glycosyltransferase family 4 protein [Aerococcus]|uniref:glycosyltransferase family 4 protein n=1 Tax=Aerococcus TaxID=1375 RepID=UPI0018E0FF47|nr:MULTISPECIES: glycosyltransferase family 4 protein [Aerococcus]MCY3036072.1 glycosyltransferase family 4 protein [Aerococcus sp. Group 2]MCY3040028.1 glycosyltransferase family 4 protein [Aerococcus sp. Group 2]MCY3040742.1 glycosyltransferase family 4 protein [Aerococcus sp. Group 2]MCY3042734.1 glycosyltransferase family 4 protein [Aerococcus sp. Group 2]MDK6520879.1 glycosyltransferase family 4 protein [Aerococcus urinae]